MTIISGKNHQHLSLGFSTSIYQEVKKAKEEFFKIFEAATNGLIKTVENFYIEGTS
jgi:hypothetical protein